MRQREPGDGRQQLFACGLRQRGVLWLRIGGGKLGKFSLVSERLRTTAQDIVRLAMGHADQPGLYRRTASERRGALPDGHKGLLEQIFGEMLIRRQAQEIGEDGATIA